VVGLGQRVIKMPVKNCSIVRQTKDVVNRVEVDTGFNFDTVTQILLSEPVPCPAHIKVSAYLVRAAVRCSTLPALCDAEGLRAAICRFEYWEAHAVAAALRVRHVAPWQLTKPLGVH